VKAVSSIDFLISEEQRYSSGWCGEVADENVSSALWRTMVHVFIGTKAQFIKMAPILQEFLKRGKSFNLIDAGQHAGLTGELLQQFGIGEPNVVLRRERSNIESVPQALTWSIRHFLRILFTPRRNLKQIFRGQKGVCLIHGDTLTTLISLLHAKRCGISVAHIEAGLRSFRLLEPFPEEIIRRIAMSLSDLLFAPSDSAFENLKKMGYGTKAINIGANTGMDAVRYALRQSGETSRPEKPYAVAAIHRFETIYSRARLAIVVEFLEKVAREREVVFVLHDPTRQQLHRFGLFSRILKHKRMSLSPLLTYLDFVRLLAHADFVVTDGGSIQEECYYLNKACMIMRARTERVEGLGENALLTGFDLSQMNRFLQVFSSLKRKELHDGLLPSALIVDHVLVWERSVPDRGKSSRFPERE
jgi:UDP-N-acetylglucosamine 2-epimerase (non-hydrolysing)